MLCAALKCFLKCNGPSEWLRTRDLLSLLALQVWLGSAGDRHLDSCLSIHGFGMEVGAKRLIRYPGSPL